MEIQREPNIDRSERGERVEDLHLDRVVASQPEIGPTPPDGGYGWLIVISAFLYHITVPALLSMYGLIILKALRQEDHDIGERFKIWDVDVALVPVLLVVIRLLLESWCRAMVKTFNMPRFMALAGLCMTVAGILLSSFSTDADSNDHIVNIFAGIFAGAGCALTGQQTEVIITHYFRDKLTTVQRIVRMAPSLGNCLVPLLVGFLSTQHPSDVVVMIYAAIVMQNCIFLVTYSRPVYIERVIRTTYNMLRDAAEDEDEVIFNHNNVQSRPDRPGQSSSQTEAQIEEDANDVVVFKSKTDAKEIIDPSIQYREKKTVRISEDRFSSDFSTMYNEPSNRFSSDFGTLDINYSRGSGYRELESIDRDAQNPQPLYRETTVTASQNSLVFAAEMTEGTARRTAQLKKNFITIVNMLMDINFYLYTLLHLSTTFSILILGVLFPPLVWEQNQSMNVWGVATLTTIAHGLALAFILLCLALPKSINEKARLCGVLCLVGAVGFYGITLSGNKSLLIVWCMIASFAVAAAGIIEQPLYNSTLNEFDTTATMTAANTVAAIFIMIYCIVYNYDYQTCFLTASILQIITACAFFVSSFRRRR